MAGGLFGKPFVFNEKCIVFSMICMALFLYKPQFQNQYFLYFTLFLIFVVAYVAMAWYDYYFNCNILPLQRGEKGGVTQQFKPPAHEKEKQEVKETKMKNALIYFAHLLFIVPLLIYVAVMRKNINPIVYPILGVLAIFTAGYHGMKVMVLSH
jgi:hypothetical protein